MPVNLNFPNFHFSFSHSIEKVSKSPDTNLAERNAQSRPRLNNRPGNNGRTTTESSASSSSAALNRITNNLQTVFRNANPQQLHILAEIILERANDIYNNITSYSRTEYPDILNNAALHTATKEHLLSVFTHPSFLQGLALTEERIEFITRQCVVEAALLLRESGIRQLPPQRTNNQETLEGEASAPRTLRPAGERDAFVDTFLHHLREGSHRGRRK